MVTAAILQASHFAVLPFCFAFIFLHQTKMNFIPPQKKKNHTEEINAKLFVT